MIRPGLLGSDLDEFNIPKTGPIVHGILPRVLSACDMSVFPKVLEAYVPPPRFGEHLPGHVPANVAQATRLAEIENRRSRVREARHHGGVLAISADERAKAKVTSDVLRFRGGVHSWKEPCTMPVTPWPALGIAN